MLPKYSSHAIKKCGAKIRNTTIPLNRSTGIYKNAPRFSVWLGRRINCYLCHMIQPNYKMGKNLNSVISKTATQWKERAKKDRNQRRNISRAQAFALELLDYMEAHDLKQTQLAERMGVSPQHLTFETLDKIADALEADIPPRKIIAKTYSYYEKTNR